MLIEEIESLPIFGKLPNGWKVMHSDDISIKISKGTTPPKLDISDSGNIPFLRVNNLAFHGRLNKDSDFIFVSKEAHENFLARSKAYPGDVLMNIVGPPLGKIAILDDSFSQYNMNQAIVFYRLDKTKVDAEFFLSYLKSNYAQSWLISRSKKTSGQQNLTIELCKELPVPLPPFLEQKKIAQILSTWDKAIATTENLLENSKKQKQALMQQLLTGKKRLHGFSDNWKHTKLKVLIEEGKLRNQNLAVERVLSVTNHSGFVLPEDQFSKRVASDDVSNYKIVKSGQYGYNPSRLNVGSFARLDDYDIGILSPMYVVFSIDEDKLNSDFFYNWMQSNEAKQRIKNSTQGSVRDSVGFDALSSFSIKLPPLTEQVKIASVLNIADKGIQTIQTKLNILKEEKKALMQQLLTGKRRVKVEH